MQDLKTMADIAEELKVNKGTVSQYVYRHKLKADMVEKNNTKYYSDQKVRIIKSWFTDIAPLQADTDNTWRDITQDITVMTNQNIIIV